MELEDKITKLEEAQNLLQSAQEILFKLGYNNIGYQLIETVLKIDDEIADLEDNLEET